MVLLAHGPIPDPTSAGREISDTPVIGRYRSPSLTYSAKQRRLISESCADVAAPIEFLHCASTAKFPHNGPIPPPADFSRALKYVGNNSSETMNAPRDQKLNRLTSLSSFTRRKRICGILLSRNSLGRPRGKFTRRYAAACRNFFSDRQPIWSRNLRTDSP